MHNCCLEPNTVTRKETEPFVDNVCFYVLSMTLQIVLIFYFPRKVNENG